MKTKNVTPGVDALESISTLKKFEKFDSLYNAIVNRYNVQNHTEIQKNFHVWIPICYRIGLVDEGLKIGSSSLSFLEPDFANSINTSIDIFDAKNKLTMVSERLQLHIRTVDINILKWNFRVKSAFSIHKKKCSLDTCLDLLGVECFISYDDFFSSKLDNIIIALKQKYEIIKFQDLLYDSNSYEYMPYVIIVMKDEDGVVFQLKIKCMGFEFAEIGSDYFNQKGFNIDTMMLNYNEEIYRINLLRNFEQKGYTKKDLAKLLYVEVRSGVYIQEHLLDEIDEMVVKYKADIVEYKKNKTNFYKNLL